MFWSTICWGMRKKRKNDDSYKVRMTGESRLMAQAPRHIDKSDICPVRNAILMDQSSLNISMFFSTLAFEVFRPPAGCPSGDLTLSLRSCTG